MATVYTKCLRQVTSKCEIPTPFNHDRGRTRLALPLSRNASVQRLLSTFQESRSRSLTLSSQNGLAPMWKDEQLGMNGSGRISRRRFKSKMAAFSPPTQIQRRPVKKNRVTDQKIIPVTQGKYSHIVQPPYAKTGKLPFSIFGHHIIELQPEETVERLRKAGALAAKVLKMACEEAKPGMTTDEVDVMVHEAILEEGAYPSPLNYRGFPKSVCSSVNEVICHGIPDLRKLEYGDVVSFDVSCFLDGVHGDNCATIIVGDDGKLNNPEFDAERRLVAAAQEALRAGVATCAPGSCLSMIGCAISDVAESYGYSTVEEYRGHGIGETFHCAPFVKHFRNDDKLELSPGMVFTIEPMISMGSPETIEWDDGWTVATADGSLSAQFEHMVYVSETGIEILTENPGLNPSGLR